MGRLVPDKDPIFFLENCMSLSHKIRFNISVVGKGSCLETIKSLSNSNTQNNTLQ